MSLLGEVDIGSLYSKFRTCATNINSVWKEIPSSEQDKCRELGNDLVDTWEKLEHTYLTHDEEQFEFVYALFISMLNEYDRIATWQVIQKGRI